MGIFGTDADNAIAFLDQFARAAHGIRECPVAIAVKHKIPLLATVAVPSWEPAEADNVVPDPILTLPEKAELSAEKFILLPSASVTAPAPFNRFASVPCAPEN